MVMLTEASTNLFTRPPEEHYPSFEALKTDATAQRDRCTEHDAKDTSIRVPSATVAIGDTKGARKGSASNSYGYGGSGVYVLDPPQGSFNLGSRGSRKSGGGGAGNAYYEGGNDGSDAHRATPAGRNSGGKVNIVFVDGHTESLTPEALDGKGANGEGNGHNALWNGVNSSIER